ncbi:metalloregulator ArsR/SmtB family transcription factor [Rhodobacteraceae bacterium RKSG542]|uniref:ArsR/SmtB family transcription factor n=1 Tax=Pseudovibrio flavus TaxID=2529854 RepID=UPI0012BC3C64|nr:metalloregulator ArsR/SmtB family transcription factor [Pseudovibrio flavus]MTI19115.1 metalloregulator ArsR/SmtB family transcription factor [Pseudovibrio flavus]
MLPVEELVACLRASGESTRVRLLALLSEGELTVKDVTTILGQSQPRISRHLKLLCEAGIIQRYPEGAWVYYRLGEKGAAAVARAILSSLDRSDPVLAGDRQRLDAIRRAKAEEAANYFASRASTWDKERTLHVPEVAVEKAMVDVIGSKPFDSFLDLGTGTGRLLELFREQYNRGIGVDSSQNMLSVARANLEKAQVANAQVRQGDIYALPIAPHSADVAVIHQVLHFLEDPARAIQEAARALRPGGRLLVVDFAPHDLEFLRENHAHRRLGFSHEQVSRWLNEADLDTICIQDLAPDTTKNNHLTVTLWLAQDRRVITDLPVANPTQELA